MKTIGVTGGVGCGKSEVLDYIEKQYHAVILKADELAAELKEKGGPCYQPLADLLGEDVLTDKKKMAQAIFTDPELLEKVNGIVHPAVREEILRRMQEAREGAVNAAGDADGAPEYFILEAALLLEEGYDKLVDEMWYIYAPEDVRHERLMKGRGYTKEKTVSIMAKQLSEKAFREGCDVIIDNGGSFAKTQKQIDAALGNPCKIINDRTD